MIKKYFLLFVVLLASCTSVPEKNVIDFDLQERQKLYQLKGWSFSGRMAVSNEQDSVTVSVEWAHQAGEDRLELSGPLGQGSSRIFLYKNEVRIESAGKHYQYFGDVDQLVSTELGFDVPATALRYWVLGLTDPLSAYSKTVDGFVQHGWQVVFKTMQLYETRQMPRKIYVMKDGAKLKLIINHWEMSM